METIYRYTINDAVNDVELPSDAHIISVGLADENGKEVTSMWVMVDTNMPNTKRKILVFGTGADMSETETYTLKFIGTVQKSNLYAFHVFEVLD